MKYILTIALTVMALSIANAQTPSTDTAKATIVNTQAPAVAIGTPAAAPTAVGAPDNSARFVGTNDLNIYLLREGVKKA